MKKIIATLILSQLALLAEGSIELVPSHNENPSKDYSKNGRNAKVQKVIDKTALDVTKVSSDKVNDINAKLKALQKRINSKKQKISSLKKTKIQESHKSKIKVKKSLKRIRTIRNH